MSIPTDREIRALHADRAPTRAAFDLVYDHCRIVCELAEQVVTHQRLDVDVDLVRAGSLLHDIGVYCLYDASGELDKANYIRHGLLGQELLRELGLPEQVCRFCSHHTGVGVGRDDVVQQALPIPVGDYLAESAEEELVMYADKFHSKSSPPRFLTAAEYAVKVRRFGAEKEAVFAAMVLRYGEPKLPDS